MNWILRDTTPKNNTTEACIIEHLFIYSLFWKRIFFYCKKAFHTDKSISVSGDIHLFEKKPYLLTIIIFTYDQKYSVLIIENVLVETLSWIYFKDKYACSNAVTVHGNHHFSFSIVALNHCFEKKQENDSEAIFVIILTID